MTRPTGPASTGSDFEAVIGQLTQPVGGQYPRPWMTSLRDPMQARVFIVGRHQVKNYPIRLVGSHGRHMDALFNRNGEDCRELYDEITNGEPSPTRSNLDNLTLRLAQHGIRDVLETNVICYSTTMSKVLARPEHVRSAANGEEIFRALLTHIRPPVLIVHGAKTAKELAQCIGVRLPCPPDRPEDVRLVQVMYGGQSMAVVVMPSLAPPEFNKWMRWADAHLNLVARSVANHLR